MQSSVVGCVKQSSCVKEDIENKPPEDVVVLVAPPQTNGPSLPPNRSSSHDTLSEVSFILVCLFFLITNDNTCRFPKFRFFNTLKSRSILLIVKSV